MLCVSITAIEVVFTYIIPSQPRADCVSATCRRAVHLPARMPTPVIEGLSRGWNRRATCHRNQYTMALLPGRRCRRRMRRHNRTARSSVKTGRLSPRRRNRSPLAHDQTHTGSERMKRIAMRMTCAVGWLGAREPGQDAAKSSHIARTHTQTKGLTQCTPLHSNCACACALVHLVRTCCKLTNKNRSLSVARGCTDWRCARASELVMSLFVPAPSF